MPDQDRSQWADPRWCEAQYNNRALVANAADYVARWPEWGAASRARLPHRADIAYGPHARERIDLFPADNAKGLFAFIHGGYWRTFSKDAFSWIAEPFVAEGYSVALVNYPLCPEVTVGAIMASCRAAMVKLWGDLGERERANLVVAGHSAGGHLVADLFTVDWTAHGLPASPFAGGLPLSGVFELAPLVHTSMNADIRLTADTARAWSLDQASPRVRAPLVFAVGGAESPEFVRQSRDQAARWAEVLPDVAVTSLVVPGRDHFSVVEDLRDPATALCGAAMRLLGGR